MLLLGLPRWVLHPLATAPPRGEVSVVLPSGTSAAGFARLLRDAGVVADEQALLEWMVTWRMDRTLRPGTYRLHPASPWEVALQLREARPEGIRITLIPGMDFLDLERLAPRQDWEVALGDDALFPPLLRPLLPHRPQDRIVFLLPDTYETPGGSDGVPSLVRAASRAWWGRVGPLVPSAQRTVAALERRGILASLVERESRDDVERPRVAAVFLNRLNRNMPLQSCATVVYAWKLQGVKKASLIYRDLEIRSPYNTYRNRGLPPGPLGIPGEGAWRAALKPAREEALFFVLRRDGRHVFSRTYEEHLKVQRETEGP